MPTRRINGTPPQPAPIQGRAPETLPGQLFLWWIDEGWSFDGERVTGGNERDVDRSETGLQEAPNGA